MLLDSRPVGIPQAEHLRIVEAPVPTLRPGQILVRNVFLSVEPAMRGWVNAAANCSEPVPVGGVMRSLAAGRVEASEHPDWKPGDLACGMFGWQDYAAVDAATIGPATFGRRITESDLLLSLSLSLGVLGLNGLTAYFGLLEVAQPRPGDTAVVSTAAGSVGSAVGQIARLSGCRTVGIAGGPQKVRQCLEEFGYDVAIDYKAGDLDARLRDACPAGVDVYFDNTAGPVSDAVMARLAVGARARSAAPRRSPTGIRCRRDRASSVTCSSSGRACRVS